MKTIWTIVLLFLVGFTESISAQIAHHKMDAVINVKTHFIQVEDEITIPNKLLESSQKLHFRLNKNLQIKECNLIYSVLRPSQRTQYNTYEIDIRNINQTKILKLSYEGVIFDNFEKGATEYARGFTETSGIIEEKGIYLAGSSLWVADFDEPVTFELKVNLPKDWKLVSQGEAVATKNPSEHVYSCTTPQEEIYLIAAPFYLFEKPSDHVQFQAFLRSNDKQLAEKYLKMTQVYLEMYEAMLGKYPYSKFALVENFWETGYGMPSFTLLGEKIIRFPWILYSSYPHELLHNYWGNSVYVDFSSGNWCEGITAYMADHMLKEQRGEGAAYRRSTIQKFTDFVNPDNDMPLSKFINRNNAAEEAIGYGKCLMINHMLRIKYGDSIFLAAYKKFYHDYKFKKASFDDIRKCFDAVSQKSNKAYFDFWTKSLGSPSLILSKVERKILDNECDIQLKITQEQKGKIFPIRIPIAFYDKEHYEIKYVEMHSKDSTFLFHFDDKILKIVVDPTFDVFRKLDAGETPSSLSQIFGSADVDIILPSKSPMLTDWEKLAKQWQANAKAQGKKVNIYMDKALQSLPSNTSCWVLGSDNALWQNVLGQHLKSSLSPKNAASLQNCIDSGSVVFTIKAQSNPNITLGFIATETPQAIPGLTRLLPHYGKYSYLGFLGNRPNNQLKGVLEPMNSPMQYIFDPKELPDMNNKIQAAKALTE